MAWDNYMLEVQYLINFGHQYDDDQLQIFENEDLSILVVTFILENLIKN